MFEPHRFEQSLLRIGATFSMTEQYDSAVQQEYGWVPEKDYRAGRSKVLRSFLERSRIFHTDALYAAFEQTARRNLAKKIRELGG